ncbi:MAG: nucleoside triphosphate pyrophosphohydrolase [Clostridiaceae bacterium]|nr:nucleoside triphosphate pyrophosphohydrolase [Clostridiaceae bacterium]
MKEKERNFLDPPYTMESLVAIMRYLRGPDGCPWDRTQTAVSIRNNILEEAAEAVEALDRRDWENFREELGDLLLQVVFQAQIAESDGRFDFDDIVDTLCRKLISRHTHVFGVDRAATSDEALNLWQRNKEAARTAAGETTAAPISTALHALPAELPRLIRAHKVQKKAAESGFDWTDIADMWEKLDEEIAELKSAATAGDLAACTEELGDLLFMTVNLARHLEVNADAALAAATRKFVDRFESMELLCAADGVNLRDLDPETREDYWRAAKSGKTNEDREGR